MTDRVGLTSNRLEADDMQPRIGEFITRVRQAHPQMMNIFTRGSCFDFYLILQEVWPEAIAFYDTVNGHVVTEIGGVLYDIAGDVSHKHDGKNLVRLPHPQYNPWDWIDSARGKGFPLLKPDRKVINLNQKRRRTKKGKLKT